MGGDGTTIWATGASQYDLNRANMVRPPLREIMDLGDLRNSPGLLAPGESGHADSAHYDDQIEAWFRHGYHAMVFAREDVEHEAAHRLRLGP